MGCDLTHLKLLENTVDVFQSTQPEWAATHKPLSQCFLCFDFNPRSPSGLRLMPKATLISYTQISIHAARVGCDQKYSCLSIGSSHFNPRSPSGLRHKPCWLATSRSKYFNPRSPSGLRQTFTNLSAAPPSISIHAARVGCDWLNRHKVLADYGFQSTQPEWAATLSSNTTKQRPSNFNPRSPSGLRR